MYEPNQRIESTVGDVPMNNCGEKYCSRIHPNVETTAARAPTKLENQLVDILSHYCGERGDNEGAVETLERIVEERNTLLRRAVERRRARGRDPGGAAPGRLLRHDGDGRALHDG